MQTFEIKIQTAEVKQPLQQPCQNTCRVKEYHSFQHPQLIHRQKMSIIQSRIIRYELLLAVSALLVSTGFGFVGQELRTGNAYLPLQYASPINNGDDHPQASFSTMTEEVDSTKTLYEVLGAPATSTRGELKKCYVKKAKLSHPDAQIASGSNSTTAENLDFNEIAQAWNVLGDDKLRRRYDRELRAQAFSESAQRFANENLERAVPAMANMVDNFAAPFLRRTTATTWAVGQAVAKEVTSHENVVLSDTLKKAVQAGQEAGRFMDGVDLKEKSKDLQNQ